MELPFNKIPLLAVCLTSLMWIGCSEPAKPVAKKEPEKVEPVTGQSALFKMYQKARTSASDVQVVKMISMPLPDVPSQPGKSGAWQASFASASLGKMQNFSYSVAEEENVHKGVFSQGEQAWSPTSGSNAAFDIRAATVDTDAAYKTALAQAGDYDQKHPNMPITFLLEKTNKYSTPVWRVIWGESVGTSNFSIYVDASLGKFLEKMH